MNDRQKREQIGKMDTDALRMIVRDRGSALPDAEHPLAGMVMIVGIGQVPVAWLRAELETRGVTV
jgi:hypothetical protein